MEIACIIIYLYVRLCYMSPEAGLRLYDEMLDLHRHVQSHVFAIAVDCPNVDVYRVSCGVLVRVRFEHERT